MSNYQSGSIDSILDRMWSSNLYESDKDHELSTDTFQFLDLENDDFDLDDQDYD